MIDEFIFEIVLESRIEFDTSNSSGRNYSRIIKLIERQLSSTRWNINLVETPKKRVKELISEAPGISGERLPLVATLERGKGETIILNTHTDIVPVGEDWTYPPFKLTRQVHEWYGRGVADDKSPLVAFILVFKEFAKNPDGQCKIILALTINKEIGSHTGLSYLLDFGLLTGDYCIVGDGGIENITNAANDCLRFRVTIKGSSVHSSMNWLSINTIEKATKLFRRLAKYDATLYKVKFKIPANLQMSVNWLTPRITVDVVKSSAKVNIIPNLCVLEIDWRVIPEEDKSEAIDIFISTLEELSRVDVDFKYDIEIGGFHDFFPTSMEKEVITDLTQTYKDVLTRKGHIYCNLGCLDTTHVAKYKIPVVAFGASRKENNYHGIDERVRIDDLLYFG